jgi:hypothetical protein
MALNFPSSPTNGQKFTSGNVVYTYSTATGAWSAAPLGTALPFNYIVNPSMMISQENGDALPLYSATGSWYCADQWYSIWIVGNVARAGRTRPALDGTDYIVLNITGGIAIPAGGMCFHMQNIEGNRVAPFQWGTASAKPAVLRFDAYASVTPGTYTISIRNGANNRSYLAPFTIAAVAAWQTFTIPIPGDMTGTWATDNTTGISVSIVFDAGTTYGGGTANAWQAGNKIAHAGATNGSFPTGFFRLANVGLYLDPDNTGRAPPFETVFTGQAYIDCQRYWHRCYGAHGVVTSTTAVGRMGMPHPAEMRAAPVITEMGGMGLYDGVNNSAIASLPQTYGNTRYVEFNPAGTATTLVVGRAARLSYLSSMDNYMAINARL